MINEDVRHIIEPELVEGEELLWADRPGKRPYPWRGVYRAGFWCVWMVLISVWIIGVLTSTLRGDPSFVLRLTFASVGIGMFAFGIGMRRSYLKAFLGPKYEVYGLTNKRAIILSPLWKEHQFINWHGQDHSKNFIDGEELEKIEVELSRDQSFGTIIFSGWWDKIRFTRYTNMHPDIPILLSNLNGFRNISNAVSVANLIADNFSPSEAPSKEQLVYEEKKTETIKQIRTKRVILWSIFPVIWVMFSLVVGASKWLFLPFFTFPFFLSSAFFAIREIIRPPHSYRITP